MLANVSHELRTPLTAIIGFAEMMRERVFGRLGSERYEGYVADIHGSASHLLEMINYILDLSRAQSGFLDVDLSEVDIGESIDFAVRMVRNRAERTGLSLVCEVDAAPDRFVTDERKLRQILLNVLTNAVKFTPKGGTVTVAVSRPADGLRIQVRDSGIGIAPEDLAKVMMPFGQVANPFTRAHEGSGLGLPLTKVMAESLGGRVDLQSMPGRGTTVTVFLPERSFADAQAGGGQAPPTGVAA